MSNTPKKIIPSGSFLQELATRIKLIIRLMADKRVNPLVKILPVASLLYMVNPIDVPGPLDDAAVVGLGIYLFLELCPPEVVQEHLDKLRSVNIKPDPSQQDGDVVVDAEFHEEEDE